MKIFKHAFIVSFFTLFSRLLGFVRDMLIAIFVGVSQTSDVFFASLKIVSFLRKIVSEGAMFAVFIPSFQKIREKFDLKRAVSFSHKMFTLMLIVSFVLLIVSEIFMKQIVILFSPGFLADMQKFEATVIATRFMFFYFVVVTLVSVMSATLNSIEKFSYYAAFPLFLNFSLILSIMFLRDKFESFLSCLVFGVLFGGVLQFVFVYVGCIFEKVRPRLIFSFSEIFSADIKGALRRFVPSIAANGLSQINSIVDMAIGSAIVHGVSYLYFNDRLFFLPVSVIGTAISVVILPSLSVLVERKSIAEIKTVQYQAFLTSTFFVVMASGFMLVFPEVIVSLLFERGGFTSYDTGIVSMLLFISGISLPFVVYGKILLSVFFSNQDIKTPMYVNLFSVATNVICSFVLSRYYGVFGIAAGSAISYVITFMIFVRILRGRNLLFYGRNYFLILVKTATALAVSLCVVYSAVHANWGLSYLNIKLLNSWVGLIYLIGIAGVCCMLYVTVLRLFGINVLGVILKAKKTQSRAREA